jgi:hypothetical protein
MILRRIKPVDDNAIAAGVNWTWIGSNPKIGVFMVKATQKPRSSRLNGVHPAAKSEPHGRDTDRLFEGSVSSNPFAVA